MHSEHKVSKSEQRVSIKAIDTVFLEKFFERVQSINPAAFTDWEDKIEQKRAIKEEKEKLIQIGIREAELQIKRINELLTRTDLTNPLPQSMVDELIKQYTGVEAKKTELLQELEEKTEEEDDDEVILYEIRTLIPRIVELWDIFPFDTRLRLIGALVRQVFLSRVTPSWFKLEIHWKMQDWGTDTAHIRRGWNGTAWSPEEDTRLREIYPTGDAGDI